MPPLRAPYFSVPDGVWVMERPADIRVILRDARFGMLGETAIDPAAVAEVADQPFRWWQASASASLLNPNAEVIDDLVNQLRAASQALAAALDAADQRAMGDDPAVMDLMATVLRPWSHAVAARLLDIPLPVVVEAEPLARRVFEVAAQVEDSTGLPADATPATLGLLERLAPYRRADRPGDGLDIQAWVALTQTLPALIAAGVLGQSPDGDHRRCPAGATADVPTRSEEARLASASPVRALFRTALTEVALGEVVIAPGDRVMLLVAHDPQFLFGDGRHRCAGASLVRTLFGAAMAVFDASPLVAKTDVITENDHFLIQRVDGRAMRTVGVLPVQLAGSL